MRPVIKDDSLSKICSCPPVIRETHNIHRTLPNRFVDTTGEATLQDEDGFPMNDEQDGSNIYDDLI